MSAQNQSITALIPVASDLAVVVVRTVSGVEDEDVHEVSAYPVIAIEATGDQDQPYEFLVVADHDGENNIYRLRDVVKESPGCRTRYQIVHVVDRGTELRESEHHFKRIARDIIAERDSYYLGLIKESENVHQ